MVVEGGYSGLSLRLAPLFMSRAAAVCKHRLGVLCVITIPNLTAIGELVFAATSAILSIVEAHLQRHSRICIGYIYLNS